MAEEDKAQAETPLEEEEKAQAETPEEPSVPEPEPEIQRFPPDVIPGTNEPVEK